MKSLIAGKSLSGCKILKACLSGRQGFAIVRINTWISGSEPKISSSIFQNIPEAGRTYFTCYIGKRFSLPVRQVGIVSKHASAGSNQNVSVSILLYIPNHTIRPVRGDCVFDIVIDIIFMWFSLLLSTGNAKNRHQEQSVDGRYFIVLFFKNFKNLKVFANFSTSFIGYGINHVARNR